LNQSPARFVPGFHYVLREGDFGGRGWILFEVTQ